MNIGEADYRTVFDAISDAILVNDAATGEILEVNQGACEMFGYTPEEARQLKMTALFGGQPDSQMESTWSASAKAAAGSTQVFECQARDRTGRVFWVEVSLKPLRFGNCECVLVLLRDVDRRKRAEAALKESEARYRVATESSLAGVCLIQDGKFRYVNPVLAEAFGYTPDELIDHLGPSDLLHPEDLDRILGVVERRLAGESVPPRSNFKGLRKDGSVIHVETLTRQVEYKGRPAALSTLLDVTGKKMTEEALKTSEANYRTLFNAVNDAILVIDPETGKFLESNLKFLEMSGYNAEEFATLTVAKVSNPDPPYTIKAKQELIRKAVTEGPQLFEWWGQTRSGSRLWVEINLTLTPLNGRDRLLAVIRDISERKRAQESLRRAHEELEQRVKERTAELKLTVDKLQQEVTERQQAEKALLESEKRFIDVAENAQAWVWEVDAEGKYTYASPTVEKLLGYKPEEILDKHFYDLFIPQELKKLKEVAFAAFADKQPFKEFTNRNLHKDGSIVCLSTSGVPIFDKTGNLLGYRGSDVDITERKRAEDALRESEGRFRQLFESAADILILHDRGEIIEVNQQACLCLGYAREELLQMTIFDLELAYSKKDLIERWEKSTNGVVAVTGIYRRRDGSTFSGEIRVSQFTYRGESLRLVAVRDITERKRAEEALQAERQRLFRLLDELPAIIQLRNQDYYLVYANKYYRQEFGDPVELPCYEILHGRQQPCEVCPSQKVFETGIPQEWEWTFSSGRTYQLYAYPFADVDGSPLVLGMGLDITDRKRAEESLLASEVALRQSQERYRMLAGHLLTVQEAERKRLARDLHDDLSQRLAALAMEAETLERPKALLTVSDHASLKGIKNKLVELSINVHAMSRRLHPSILDDLGLADAIASECAMFQERNRVMVNFRFKNITKKVPSNVAVCLYRIVQEALRNISRHAEATEVTIVLVGKNDTIHLAIIDDGKGFDPDREKGKDGLGLDSMRERAYLIGGDFSIRSQPGQGTAIDVVAPLSKSVA